VRLSLREIHQNLAAACTCAATRPLGVLLFAAGGQCLVVVGVAAARRVQLMVPGGPRGLLVRNVTTAALFEILDQQHPASTGVITVKSA
jgi:hypothetical protein